MAKRNSKSTHLAKSPQRVKVEPIPTVEVPVHYVKSPQFRTIHADGILGGILPSGRAMNLAFYNERIPFATQEIFDIGPDGQMIKPRVRHKKEGFYREIEVSAVFDYDTAKSLLDWLTGVVKVLKQLSGRQEEGTSNDSRHVLPAEGDSGSKESETIGSDPLAKGISPTANRKKRAKKR